MSRRSRSPRRVVRTSAALVAMAVVVAAGPLACGPVRDESVRARAAETVPLERQPPHLLIRLSERRLYLMDNGSPSPVESFPIAIGRTGHDTPTGRFRIDEMVVRPDYEKLDPTDRSRVLKRIAPGPDNPLGERWMTFVRGDGWTIGIHGTPQPELLGRAVSGGCIRMRNADVIRVYDRVGLGTTVVVEP